MKLNHTRPLFISMSQNQAKTVARIEAKVIAA